MKTQHDESSQNSPQLSKRWLTIGKKALFYLVAASALAPRLVSAQGIHVEWGYTPPSEPTVTSYKLYQDGALVATATSKAINDGNKNKFYVKSDGGYAADFNVTLTAAITPFTLTAGFSDGSESPQSAPFNFGLDKTTATASSGTANGNVAVVTVDSLTGTLSTAIGGTFATAANGGWVVTDNADLTNGSGGNSLGAKIFMCTKLTGLGTIWTLDENGIITGILPAFQVTSGGLPYKIIDAKMKPDQSGYKVLSVYSTTTGDKIAVSDVSFTGAVTNTMTQGPFAAIPDLWKVIQNGGLVYNPETMNWSAVLSKGPFTNLGADLIFNPANNNLITLYALTPPETRSYLTTRNLDSLANNRLKWNNITTGYVDTGRVCLSTTTSTGTPVTGSGQCLGGYSTISTTGVSLPWTEIGFSSAGQEATLGWGRAAGVGATDGLNAPGLAFRLGSLNQLLYLQLFPAETGKNYISLKDGTLEQGNAAGDRTYTTYGYDDLRATRFYPVTTIKYTAATGATTYTKN